MKVSPLSFCSEQSCLRCPSNKLNPNPVHPLHSQGKSQTLPPPALPPVYHRYPSVTAHSQHSSPPTPPCLFSPLLFSATLLKYLKSSTFATSTPCSFSISAPAIISILLPLYLFRHTSACCLLSLQITMLSANILVHVDSCLISSVTTANKKGLRAEP